MTLHLYAAFFPIVLCPLSPFHQHICKTIPAYYVIVLVRLSMPLLFLKIAIWKNVKISFYRHRFSTRNIYCTVHCTIYRQLCFLSYQVFFFMLYNVKYVSRSCANYWHAVRMAKLAPQCVLYCKKPPGGVYIESALFFGNDTTIMCELNMDTSRVTADCKN